MHALTAYSKSPTKSLDVYSAHHISVNTANQSVLIVKEIKEGLKDQCSS